MSDIGDKLHAIIARKTGNSVPCSECKAEIDRLNTMSVGDVLMDIIPLSDRIIARSAKNAQKWYQRAAAAYLPGMVANHLRDWILEACGITPVPHIVLPKEILCGCIHDSQVPAFKQHIDKIVSGVQFLQPMPSHTSLRRVLGNESNYKQIREEVLKWNNGKDRPDEDLPYIRGTWSYAVTTVPVRSNDLLLRTLDSLAMSGFNQPVIAIDGPADELLPRLRNDYQIISRHSNVRTFAHWHLTLLELYSRNPWSEFYAIFQDDMLCVQNLRQYLTACTWPEKSYLNLFTFMENDAIVDSATARGWLEAARAKEGHQLGRGAVALAFSHDAVETLLSSRHMTIRRRDSLRGHKSLDGAIVESMNQAGYSEYVHNPSLIQHTGTVSSMGNKTHPVSKWFDLEFDPLTLL